ncbi:GSCFA domain-containing protein [Cytophaga aurantiaca]|uniref:GSCFA domain-containing protein n=1 Tax=Cytophaga aurantiaca TaxID=29530 RepID=UPI0003692F8C|nr:GSCFA domain-containing protein [Cytophaga aurantiaca]
MQTRTEISPGKAPFTLEHNQTVVTIGSCFSDMIGARLQSYKFDVAANPFGTTFNPISIFQLLSISIDQKFNPFPAALGEVWYDHQFHSEVSALSSAELHAISNERIAATTKTLARASVLVITLGTAWVYRHVDTNTIVNNCHKQSGRYFKKELLSVKHILEDFDVLYSKLKTFNPNIKIIFTVSPVRHIKDTLQLNSVSKSILLSSVHYICEQHNDCHYFPAYEIQLDDLRDYRYYAEDLIHPSTQAEKYIWNKLAQWLFSSDLQEALTEWDQLQKLLHHKAYHPTSEAHQQFIIQAIDRFSQFQYWNTADEIASLKAQRN